MVRHQVVVYDSDWPNLPSILKALMELGVHHQVVFVNLLKFRTKARYLDGKNPNWTGRQAYMKYEEHAKKVLESMGCSKVVSASIEGLFTGTTTKMWDACLVVKYPSLKTALEIVSSPLFWEIQRHRIAGLQGELLLITVETNNFASEDDSHDHDGEELQGEKQPFLNPTRANL